VLDCYAQWCNVCKKLDPILKPKLKAFGDSIVVVKLDIDVLPQIAQALQVLENPLRFTQVA
jgi:thioredoxin-like negative regulator of GroEL